MKLLIVFFSISVSSVCIAQKNEYVVTKKGDTIYGKITRVTGLLNPSKIGFKIKDLNGNKRVLNPKDVETIQSFRGVDGESTIKTIYNKWYVKLIIDGKIKVYQSVDGIIFYTSKNNSDIRLNDFGGFNNREKAHKRIRPLFMDNPSILKEFDSLVGTRKNIIYMIEKYNRSYE